MISITMDLIFILLDLFFTIFYDRLQRFFHRFYSFLIYAIEGLGAIFQYYLLDIRDHLFAR